MVFTLLLACSLSVDAIGIGIAYGIQKIKIPFSTKLILTSETILLLSLFLFCGKQLMRIFPPPFGAYLGIFLLFCIGIWMVYHGYSHKENSKKVDSQRENPLHFPSLCDKDHSKHLDHKEALLLGFVLSLDAFGTGIGAGASGLSLPLLPLFAALLQTSFLSFGFFLGHSLSSQIKMEEGNWSSFSGFLLLLIACIRIFSM